MIADKYIPNASTAEEHLNNVFFQAFNVEGWLRVGTKDNALAKAECLTGGYPTEKPFALIEELVLNSSKEGDWVLDPFCGGGHYRRCLSQAQSQLRDARYFSGRHRLCEPSLGTAS